MLADQELLGGSILRPLNTTLARNSWMNIPSPFLQIIQEYGNGKFVNYFSLFLKGDGEIFKKDKTYEVHYLSGPQTTKDEYEFLKNLELDRPVQKNPGCCMSTKLVNILNQGASKIVVSDFDYYHQKVLGVIE